MNLQEINSIISKINNNVFSPVYFLMGEETYYIDLITNLLEQKVLNNDERSFNQTVLYGKDFWENVIGWDKFIEAGTISKKDLNLFKIVDDVDTAKTFLIDEITKYYKLHF